MGLSAYKYYTLLPLLSSTKNIKKIWRQKEKDEKKKKSEIKKI